ncbi:hypothetical protein FOA52_006175 [Chlamydomonas sp. UWO 241]|nr:hypothetical protein FOA52_006175 [Chlamydomonas sp. UWO 241]
MPVGGKLTLKGGEPLLVERKIKKKKKKSTGAAEDPEAGEGQEAAPDPTKPKPANANSNSVLSGKAYEDEFEFEKLRRVEGKTKTCAWGSSYRAAPEILHGYSHKVTGKTAEERLDMRAATKTDKFAK